MSDAAPDPFRMSRRVCNQMAVDAVRYSMRPPPSEPPSQWVESHRRLSTRSSAIPGPISLGPTPYIREILDALVSPNVEQITLRFASQTGKTECLLHCITYLIAADPGPMLWVLPSLQTVRDISQDRLQPALELTSGFEHLVSHKKSRDSDNTLVRKKFLGGQIILVSANQVDSLVSRPIRYLFFDEADRCRAEAGDAFLLAKQRTMSYGNRKIIVSGTPLIKGYSTIDEQYDAGSMARLLVPCPRCGEYQELRWEGVVFTSRSETHYRCSHCEELLTEKDRRDMVPQGYWRHDDGGNPNLSYHLSALYSLSPNMSLNVLAHKWGREHKNPDMRRTFLNEQLAESWEAETEGVSSRNLSTISSHEPISDATVGIIMSTDVQGDRLETTISSISPGQIRILEHAVIPGDPSRGEVWEQLTKLRQLDRVTDTGVVLPVLAHVIDAGYLSEHVHRYCSTYKSERVIPIKGYAGGIGQPPVIRRRARVKSGALRTFILNVDELKLRVYSRLSESGSDSIIFSDALDEEYNEQIASERLETKWRKGTPHKIWVRIQGRDAEAWDCLVYTLGAVELLGGWEAIERQQGKMVQEVETTESSPLQEKTSETKKINWNHHLSRLGGTRRW